MTNVTPIPILVGERIQQLDMLMHIQEFSSMVAVVTGDAGMGKTALVESAASQLSIHHQVISFSAAEIQSEVDVVEFISQQ
jgi:adenylate kinase